MPAETERLGVPLAVSASCHAILFASSVIWGFLNPTISLGSRDAAGGGGIVSIASVPINVVRADEPNPVANPSRNQVPAPESFRRSTEIEAPEPAPDERPAPPVPATPRKKAETQQERAVGQRSAGEAKSNELRSSKGQALSSDLYRASPGSALGFGGREGGPFGDRFGWYAKILQQAIGQEWRKALGQVVGGSSKPVVTSFVIQRTGLISQITISQSSGNRTLDISARRAISNASPVRALPAGLGKQSVVIEMHFLLD